MLCLSSEHNLRYFGLKPGCLWSHWLPKDTVKAQKSIKGCVQFASSGYSPKCRYADAEETNLLNKVVFFFFVLKVFSSLHNIQINPLMVMADGVFWQCFSYFSGPWHCNLLGSKWDSHKPPGFHPKYLKLCSKTNKAFMGLERHGGKWLMTQFS